MGPNNRVPPSALTACREARRQGHLLYICSGRPRSIIGEPVRSIGFDGVISSGGAHIETGFVSAPPFRGTVIFDAVMPAETVKRITAYLRDRGAGFCLEKNDAVSSNQDYLRYWEALNRRFAGAPEAGLFDSLIGSIKQSLLPEPIEESCCAGVNKIGFVESGTVVFDDVQKAFAGSCEIFHGSIPYCGRESGEIGPLGVHKGSAVKIVAEHHGVSLARTIAFGDSDNDRRMIECAGTGVAMGNAEEALKALADHVTSDLEDDGLFNGFVKYGLI